MKTIPTVASENFIINGNNNNSGSLRYQQSLE